MLEMNQVYNMDCMEGMKDISDKFFELAIVDPPYGIGITKKNSADKKQSKISAIESTDYGSQTWDKSIPNKEYFDELFRISKNQIIWGVNYYKGCTFDSGRIYWQKNVTMPTYSDGELAYCSLINNIKCFNFTWHGMLQQHMGTNKEVRIHPTQKPADLYRWLLRNYAKKGDKILDTHMGSGSSIIACHDMGFEYMAFELDKDYYEAAMERINNHIAQVRFDL